MGKMPPHASYLGYVYYIRLCNNISTHLSSTLFKQDGTGCMSGDVLVAGLSSNRDISTTCFEICIPRCLVGFQRSFRYGISFFPASSINTSDDE
jgi:hypothetical protein